MFSGLRSPALLLGSLYLYLFQVVASPVPARNETEIQNLVARSVTTMTAAQLSALAPYTQLARAAYCPSSRISSWSCGRKERGLSLVNLDSNPYRGLQCHTRVSADSDRW